MNCRRRSFTPLWVCFTLLLSPSTFAKEGGGHGVGGGGDTKTEAKILGIRDNILAWIEIGNARKLKFRADISYEVYVDGDPARAILGMRAALDTGPGNTVVTVIKTAQEVLANPEQNTWVDGQPKTCKHFRSRKDSRNHILCNYERYWDHNEAERYRLIHHEYAGLAGVEPADGAASSYFFSDQIASELQWKESYVFP